MNQWATLVGYGLGLLLASIAVTAALLFVAWMNKVLAVQVFNQLRRHYHYTVLSYWLDRLEKEGKRTFQRPD